MGHPLKMDSYEDFRKLPNNCNNCFTLWQFWTTSVECGQFAIALAMAAGGTVFLYEIGKSARSASG
jgi:hypothetical protein